MPRAVLILLALAFIGFGLAFTLKPLEMAQVIEIDLFTPTSRTDFRATYGGLETGLGLFLLVSALGRQMLAAGLHAAAWAYGTMAAVRISGLVIDGINQPLMVVVALLELGATGLAVWALVAMRTLRPMSAAAPAATPWTSPDRTGEPAGQVEP